MYQAAENNGGFDAIPASDVNPTTLEVTPGSPEVDPNENYDLLEPPGKDKLRFEAAKSISPGCPQWVISTWLPSHHKPQLKHLVHEIKQRGFPNPPACWKAQQCADWLHKNGPERGERLAALATTIDLVTAVPIVQASAAAVTNSNIVVGELQQAATPAQAAEPTHRWHNIRQGCRLVHTIVELKEDFLRRDEGHLTRNEKDSAARNSFWVRAAEKFNDDNFTPILLRVDDEYVNTIFSDAKMDPSSARYKGVSSSPNLRRHL